MLFMHVYDAYYCLFDLHQKTLVALVIMLITKFNPGSGLYVLKGFALSESHTS
ncbi:hypothetical protein Hdeb2414_s0016g00497041 [Helianthus debilis subsp. tardiflorus]